MKEALCITIHTNPVFHLQWPMSRQADIYRQHSGLKLCHQITDKKESKHHYSRTTLALAMSAERMIGNNEIK